MRAMVLLILGSLVCAPAFAGVWTSLWRTPDQQGEALLAAGQPAKAAERFSDPRLKAYADLRAGRYGAAARLLAPLQDPTSEYNRGNALAHLGHLRQALAAYDAALKQAPGDADIRHNRDLVERMLARQRPPRAPAHGGGKRHGSGRSQRGKGQGPQPNAAPRAGKGQRSSPSGANSRGSSRQAGRSGTTADQRRSRSTHARRTGAGAHREQAPRASGTPGESAGARRRTPGQARRDAALAAALARREAKRGNPHPVRAGRAKQSPRTARRLAARTDRIRPPRPVSEKTLALQQWLRQLPNNPAGLLRREFLIKYMMRHRGTEP